VPFIYLLSSTTGIELSVVFFYLLLDFYYFCSYIVGIIINKHTNTMALSLNEQIERLEKLLRNTTNNEDYLDIYSCLVETQEELEQEKNKD